MKNILTINGRNYEIDSYYEFEDILRAQLETVREDFYLYDGVKQSNILCAFGVSNLEELDEIDILNFDLDTIMNTIENLTDFNYSYSGINFNGRINPWYIDNHYEEE